MKDSELKAYTLTGIVPLREKPADSSEMVSQLLLGETMDVLHEQQDDWVKVKAHHDGYEGWVNGKEVELFEPDEFQEWEKNERLQRSPYFTFRAAAGRDEQVLVPAGALIAIHDDQICLPHNRYDLPGGLRTIKRSSIMDTAQNYVGTPYLWGGRTDVGIDCSGFIQIVLALHGYATPRDSGDQFSVLPTEETNLNNAKPGDLVYFNPSGGKITHVGFYLGNGALIHASGQVHISNIDEKDTFQNQYRLNKKLARSIYAIQPLQEFCEAL